MSDPDRAHGDVSEANLALSRVWTGFAESGCRGYSALYERISLAVARDDDVLDLVRAAPPHAHMPPLLLAAVHDLVLRGLEHPLADVYAGRSVADPAPLFVDVCRAYADELAPLLASRHIQTNECGRSAVIGPGITWIAQRSERPLALVDVGASAGLNLLCDRYRLDYAEHGATGPATSPVHIRCRVAGGVPPVAPTLPSFVTRVGLDRLPVDLTDPDDARWQLACVWPDTGRLDRTAAAIALARHDPPTVVTGDAVEGLPALLAGLPAGVVALVLTTWAFAYLLVEDRRRFVDMLVDESRGRTIVWLSAEAPGTVEAFADSVGAERAPSEFDVLGVLTFDGGECRRQLLGFVNSHGHSLDWRGPDTPGLGTWWPADGGGE